MNKIIVSLIALSSLFASCARTISSDIYSANHVGETSKTYAGVIVASRIVTIQDKERLEENGLGIIGGALGGGLAGSYVGKGTGNTLATVGGALAGATVGAFAEKTLKTQNGIEYVVSLDNGESVTVVQGPEPRLSEGQRVLVMVSKKGRSRVVAAR